MSTHNKKDYGITNFLKNELLATPRNWKALNNRSVRDLLGRKYRTKLFNVGPVSFYLYFIPNFEIPPYQELDQVTTDRDHLGLKLPSSVAVRFHFSLRQDSFNYLPSESTQPHCSSQEIGNWLSCTALPESDIAKEFQGVGLYKQLARLLFICLPQNAKLFLIDIVHIDTRNKLKNNIPFAETVFGRSFLSAGFKHLDQRPNDVYCFDKKASPPWYAVELGK
jgi:hypothetical protein